MDRSIVLKTDASYKKDVGCGVSYVAQIDDGESRKSSIQNSRMVEKVKNSTHGETVAVVFGIIEVLDRIENSKQYELYIKSDCEYTVDKLDERYPEQKKVVKTALNLLEQFPDWGITWIPRSTNRKADALARSTLMNYEDGFYD